MDNPQRWECGNCGHAFYDTDGWDEWHCGQCGEEMHTMPPEGYTSNEDLRELAEKWRWNFEEDMGEPEWAMAANELEELIDGE